MTPAQRLGEHLFALYGDEVGSAVLPRLYELIEHHRRQLGEIRPVAPIDRLHEADAVLITYADQVTSANEPPLETLHRFIGGHLAEAVTGVHLLPFYPYSSDDGFSVVDYGLVDADLGDWSHLTSLADDFRLMFDAVINHVSAQSRWFQGFLEGRPPYRDYFVTVDPAVDLSQVVRPRATPLLTPFDTADGVKHVWTTFSSDQVDLNYSNPAVLLDVIDVLLEYVGRGADILRLDAVTYLWKEIGTDCANHPKAHRIVKLIRSVLEAACPRVVLLTESNVPHEENVAYFGDGTDEAQMVYNFALPPLVLDAFLTGDATALKHWAAPLATPSDETAFFNFLASHDGIGVRPVEGILGEAGIERLVRATKERGGLVSYRRGSDGADSPYELNITYFDALNDPAGGESEHVQVNRFLAAHAAMLSLAGVPGLYIHSLLGSRNYLAGVERTGRSRIINREKFTLSRLEAELEDAAGRRRRVLDGLTRLLRARTYDPAFHPQCEQEILESPPQVFAIRRAGEVYCLHNVAPRPGRMALRGDFTDLVSGEEVRLSGSLALPPLEARWLRAR